MRKLIFATACLIAQFAAFGQQRNGIEVGLQVGVSNYFGDFSPKNIVSSQTQFCSGGFARIDLRPNWSLRFNYLRSKITGSDDNFEASSPERARGFYFENTLSQFAAVVEWSPFEKMRLAADEFRPGFSPYLAVGHGLAFNNPKLGSNLEGNLPNPELFADLQADLRTHGGRPAPMFHLGIGTKIWMTENLSLGVDLAVQPSLSDYLDGVKKIGNPSRNDWQVFGAIQLAYKFFEKIEDRDRDGTPDGDDACPDQPGKKRHGGCPESEFGRTNRQQKIKVEKDVDGDGIAEPFDRCPNEAGNPVFNGCPDADGDGLIDLIDKCPDFFGSAELQGCPDEAFGDAENIVNMDLQKDLAAVQMILEHAAEGIQFDPAADTLTEDSEAYLDNVVTMMTNFQFIKIQIEGHTDNSGKAKTNLQLSERRAQKCVEYIVKQGVAADRLTAKGFGETRPVADNSTEEGRLKNRRVVFTILD